MLFQSWLISPPDTGGHPRQHWMLSPVPRMPALDELPPRRENPDLLLLVLDCDCMIWRPLLRVVLALVVLLMQ